MYKRQIPHGIAVVVERFKERPGTDLVDIDVNIYCCLLCTSVMV